MEKKNINPMKADIFPSEHQTIILDKSFFIKERDTSYDWWQMAWWREQFQNSTDAGAKNIRITLKEAEARGGFAEYRGSEYKNVVRVVFADDGCGMSRNTLQNVFFKPGRSTKVGDAGMVGGFGRARLMTCFAQDRYSILTKNSFVLGNGEKYQIYPLATAAETLKALEAAAEKNAPGVDVYDNSTIKGLRTDREMIENVILGNGKKGYDGCRIEVDMETWKTPGFEGNKPASLEEIQSALKKYLLESQIKATVTINGQTPEKFFFSSSPIESRKGKAKAILSTGEGADKEDFAKVYVKKSEYTDYTRMLVRVDGAAMYSETIYTLKGFDVIVEIDPKKSRDVLNSNRDGMHSKYGQEVRAFAQKLAVDTVSALKDKSGQKYYVVSGEHGVQRSTRKALPDVVKYSDADRNTLQPRLDTVEPKKPREITFLKDTEITYDVAKAFITSVKNNDSFLNAVRWGETGSDEAREQVQKLTAALADKSSREDPQAALVESCPPELLPWIVEELSGRVKQARDDLKAEHVSLLSNMHDTVLKVDSFNEKTKPVIKKFDPNNWSVESGSGKKPHALMAAWTSAITIVNEALFEVRPALEPFSWRVGFLFAVASLKFEGDATRPTRPEAAKGEAEHDSSIHEFFINPITDAGRLKYDLTKDEDIWTLITLAVHEVSHVMHEWHDEAFAGLQTKLMAKLSPVAAIKQVKQNVAATFAAYGGKTTVHALDNNPGPRPADRLRSIATGYNPDVGFENENKFATGVR
jgi:hypothetical protein